MAAVTRFVIDGHAPSAVLRPLPASVLWPWSGWPAGVQSSQPTLCLLASFPGLWAFLGAD